MHAVCGLSPLDRNNESVKNIYMNGSQIHGENDKGTLLEHKSKTSFFKQDSALSMQSILKEYRQTCTGDLIPVCSC